MTPCGVTMVGVTTLMLEAGVVGVARAAWPVPWIFWVAAAAAARAAMPVIWPLLVCKTMLDPLNPLKPG